nr:Trm112 family protein [Candidatus Sigynarchaeota archaeon]
MKIWLNEVLSCPVDHHFPLKLMIFQLENEDQAIKTLASIESMCKDLQWFFQEDDGEQAGASNHVIQINQIGEKILMFDALVRKPSIPGDYLKGILHSIEELKFVTDVKGSDLKKVIDQLVSFENQTKTAFDHLVGKENEVNEVNAIIKGVERNIIILNWIKQIPEIDEGILFCSSCKRWFPIRGTIPQLLPDELRKEKYDIEFLEKWNDAIPDEIKQSGLPFHL